MCPIYLSLLHEDVAKQNECCMPPCRIAQCLRLCLKKSRASFGALRQYFINRYSLVYFPGISNILGSTSLLTVTDFNT